MSALPNYIVEHGPADVRVERCEGVVKEVHVSARVHSARKRDPLLLSTGQVDPVLPDLGSVACGQLVEVAGQTTGLHYLDTEQNNIKRNNKNISAKGRCRLEEV